ncbi:MAG: CarD family transcriptional regulator [Oscillospiraceae bacterium]|jgi:CarD family transcriptional regulator|nr:CarD family transcriptional regulator [Oscillospiraceae bacterium]
MYSVGDTVVHPLHGAGIIDGVEERRVSGVSAKYYVFRVPLSGMRLMIPTEGCGAVGVRPLIGAEKADELLAALPAVVSDATPNWNRRYRENLEHLKSGDLLAVAGVIKGLLLRDSSKGLSSGERDILRLAKQILISEIALSKSSTYEEIEEQVTLCLKS